MLLEECAFCDSKELTYIEKQEANVIKQCRNQKSSKLNSIVWKMKKKIILKLKTSNRNKKK